MKHQDPVGISEMQTAFCGPQVGVGGPADRAARGAGARFPEGLPAASFSAPGGTVSLGHVGRHLVDITSHAGHPVFTNWEILHKDLDVVPLVMLFQNEIWQWSHCG